MSMKTELSQFYNFSFTIWLLSLFTLLFKVNIKKMIFLDNKCRAFGLIIDSHTLQRLSLPWLLPVLMDTSNRILRLWYSRRDVIGVRKIWPILF